jgi:hypothetical protein
MKSSQKLENKIRGWFPQEPNLPNYIQQRTQPTKINQKIKPMDIRKGITNVGFLTLFASIGLVAFAAIVYGEPFQYPIFFKLVISSWVAFAAVGIALSTTLLIGKSSKRLWYASMSYWILLLSFWVGFDLRDPGGTLRAVTYGFYIEIFGPIVYSACCIGYFLTKGPKQYFHCLGLKT